MRSSILLIIPLILFMVVTEIYTYRGIKPLLNRISSNFLSNFLRYLFWTVTLLFFVCFLIFFLKARAIEDPQKYVMVNYLVGSFFLFYIPKFFFILFVFIADIRKGVLWLSTLVNQKQRDRKRGGISRADFLYKAGVITAAIPFASILYGLTKGKFNFNLTHSKVASPKLPKNFSGFRIVQISDIHLGSLNNNYDAIAEAVDLINQQQPDLILFTGDLVNNFADETKGWAPVLGKMKARYGKYSVLGNHDYGDYTDWKTAALKQENLDRIIAFHEKMEFDILLNENRTIKVGEQQIALIGVENWGKPPFPQHGDLVTATSGIDKKTFKILMSHDPSHWDEQVLNTDIDLTFAGHTHGMQVGVEIAGVKWSPIKYKYPRWGGLYKEQDQYLYVNRGLGYIGFPGRVGMPPEITVVDLA